MCALELAGRLGIVRVTSHASRERFDRNPRHEWSQLFQWRLMAIQPCRRSVPPGLGVGRLTSQPQVLHSWLEQEWVRLWVSRPASPQQFPEVLASSFPCREKRTREWSRCCHSGPVGAVDSSITPLGWRIAESRARSHPTVPDAGRRVRGSHRDHRDRIYSAFSRESA